MNLKPQDIFVLLKLVVLRDKPWSFSKLAIELDMSSSEVHAAMKRALSAGLAVKKDKVIMPQRRNLEEFLLHGVRYAFAAYRGELVRGMPTGHAAEPLSSVIVPDNEPPPVWPDAQGTIRGVALSPLYRSVPQAARSDRQLYELLALVDAIRAGRARERELAGNMLQQYLNSYD